MSDDIVLYKEMLRIRRFDETVLENFSKGIFFGTTHTYIGQEANAVGVLQNIQPDDIVFSNHRSHGHFLAYGGDPRALMAELMGKSTGVCGGRGGSQHLHWKNFYSNGVQGGIIPIATGMALAEKFKQSGAIVIAFLGDGTLGEGVVYEAFNMASLWRIPIFFVLENNHIAQTTPDSMAIAGSITGRFSAFDIPVDEIDTSDVRVINPISARIINNVRNEKFPHSLIINTCRFGPHSKGDDTRSPDTLQHMRDERDPLIIQASRLPDIQKEIIDKDVSDEIETALQKAFNDPYPAIEIWK